METLFISDLHLDETRPEIVNVFLNFLYERASHTDALYILGDLFEVWIGDDNQTRFNRTIIHALKTLTDMGLPVYLMHGNRDFLIGKRFLKETGCQLLTDPFCINLYGTPLLLTHGDLLCTQDTQYQLSRKILRNRIFQFFCISSRSLEKRLEIARHYRKISQRTTSSKTRKTLDVTKDAINKMMIKEKVNYLIHGHTHHPAIHHFSLVGKSATRAVLGPWELYGSILICKPNERQDGLSLELQSVL